LKIWLKFFEKEVVYIVILYIETLFLTFCKEQKATTKAEDEDERAKDLIDV
jgi:hypothetical protein